MAHRALAGREDSMALHHIYLRFISSREGGGRTRTRIEDIFSDGTTTPKAQQGHQGPLSKARAREYQIKSFLTAYTNSSSYWVLLNYCDDFLRNVGEEPDGW
uniref:Uncharacterized protein n=1 Tax=Arundo donax TaxID=35708 RepID=A0A0A8XZA2_ARUDO